MRLTIDNIIYILITTSSHPILLGNKKRCSNSVDVRTRGTTRMTERVTDGGEPQEGLSGARSVQAEVEVPKVASGPSLEKCVEESESLDTLLLGLDIPASKPRHMNSSPQKTRRSPYDLPPIVSPGGKPKGHKQEKKVPSYLREEPDLMVWRSPTSTMPRRELGNEEKFPPHRFSGVSAPTADEIERRKKYRAQHRRLSNLQHERTERMKQKLADATLRAEQAEVARLRARDKLQVRPTRRGELISSQQGSVDAEVVRAPVVDEASRSKNVAGEVSFEAAQEAGEEPDDSTYNPSALEKWRMHGRRQGELRRRRKREHQLKSMERSKSCAVALGAEYLQSIQDPETLLRLLDATDSWQREVSRKCVLPGDHLQRSAAVKSSPNRKKVVKEDTQAHESWMCRKQAREKKAAKARCKKIREDIEFIQGLSTAQKKRNKKMRHDELLQQSREAGLVLKSEFLKHRTGESTERNATSAQSSLYEEPRTFMEPKRKGKGLRPIKEGAAL
ncbi:hypothetical protein CYMTET_28086 [Cymbomonas tetramitiformis]|uniref:Uncharacterized protein n=1 Tax=Cymbomonas tetramitiformis TaxID=36881 RepID=A0AAE0FQ15_9CHLO|nr:hypothetical protein CYMTET_28086 [Cymbomonas tetramitiformis]